MLLTSIGKAVFVKNLRDAKLLEAKASENSLPEHPRAERRFADEL